MNDLSDSFTDPAGVRPVDFGGAGGFVFPAQDGTALFEAGDELLEVVPFELDDGFQ